MLAPAVSVVIPAFNEESTIGDVIRKVQTVSGLGSVPYEIVVVDDGSSDKTVVVAKSHNARVISNWRNRGKGVALKKGFECALGDIIVTIDADGSHDPRDIGKLVRPILDGADVVLGCRFLDGRRSRNDDEAQCFREFYDQFCDLAYHRKKGQR